MVRLLVVVLLCMCVLAGCVVNLPFNNRLDYSKVSEAKRFTPANATPVAIDWIPSTFPNRVDIQGASGFVGGGSQTRIPTGIALSNRIIEALDVSVGIDANSKNQLALHILKAESKFEYSAGFANVTPGMDYGWCNLEVEFDFDGTVWKESFLAEEKDPTIGASSQTAILERAWDNVAVQVAKNVAGKIAMAPKNDNYKNSEQYLMKKKKIVDEMAKAEAERMAREKEAQALRERKY